MAVIQWVQYNERVVGENSPLYPDDVTNRPLKQILTDSDLAITDDFPGFPAEFKGTGSPEGVQVAVPGQLYFQQDAPFVLWIKQIDSGLATGWATVGAGITGTAHFIPKFNAAGDGIEDSIMFQSAAPSSIAIIVGAVDPSSAADETFRTQGGIISAHVAGVDSTIIGRDAGQFGAAANSIAIGTTSTASGAASVAIGNTAIATGADSIAFGDASASFDNAIAIGVGANGIAFAGVALGAGALASGFAGIAIGSNTTAATVDGISMGRGTTLSGGTSNIAIGLNCMARSTGAISIGENAQQGATLSTTLNDSMIVGANSTISSAALATGGFQSAIVIFGPRNIVTTVGGQPANYVTVVGANNLITAAIGGSNGTSIYIGQFITIDTALNMVVVGNSFSVSAQAGQTVAIGNGISSTVSSTNCVYIGQSVLHQGGNSHIIIGRGANKIGGFGDNDTIIGDLAQVNNIDFAIVLGSGAKASGGQGNIAIGRASNVTHTNAIAIGPGAVSERNNSCVIGSDNSGGEYLTFVFGNRGDTSPSGIAAVTWRPTNAETGGTANLPTAALIISGGIPLGNDATAGSGEIQFVTGAPGGSSNAAQTATKQFAILKSAGGAAAPNTAWYNVTTGAAAQVGTLTNAPTAGNATFWLPVQINGATFYIPCWS